MRGISVRGSTTYSITLIFTIMLSARCFSLVSNTVRYALPCRICAQLAVGRSATMSTTAESAPKKKTLSILTKVKSRLAATNMPLKREREADEAQILSSTPSQNDFNEFSKLGLISSVVSGLSAQGFSVPTPVQKGVIPRLLAGENLVMAASTGSGKTLAFVLPVLQHLISQEQLGTFSRQPKRPRCLILVPTRELAKQILLTIKNMSHYARVSSTAVLGGEPYGLQKRALDRLVDIVVASPGRLMQHKEQGNLFLSQVTHVVIDEVDTMLTQGFGSDIRAVLRAALNKHPRAESNSSSEALTELPEPAQIVMATATLTKAVKALLGDVNGNFNIEFSDADNKTPRRLTGNETSVHMSVVEVDGVHRTLPHVQHLVEETRGEDKLAVLNTVLDRYKGA